MCFTRASGTVYTAIDIATGQEVRHIVMLMEQHSNTVGYLFFLTRPSGLFVFSVVHSLFLFSGGHQANEPAAAAQERADHQWDLGDEGKQKLQHCELPGQVSFHMQHTSHKHVIITPEVKAYLWLFLRRDVYRNHITAQNDVFKWLYFLLYNRETGKLRS